MNRKLLPVVWAMAIAASAAARPASAQSVRYTLSEPTHQLRDAVVDPGLNRIFALEVYEGTARNERLLAFDLATRTVVGDVVLESGSPSDRPRLTIDPETHTIHVLQVIADRTSRVTVIDGNTLTILATAPLPDLRLIRAGFHHASQSAYAAPQAGDVGLHEISLEPETLGQSRHLIPTPFRPFQIDVHQTTRRVYALGLSGGLVAIDGNTRQVIASIPLAATGVAVDQHTRQVYVTAGAQVLMLDPDTLATVSTVSIPQTGSNPPAPTVVAVNSATGRAYVGLVNENRMPVINGATAALEHTFGVGAGITDGGRLLVNDANGHIYIARGGHLTIVEGAYAPDSLVVTVSSQNNQVRLEWSATVDNGAAISGYEILMDGVVVATVDATTTSYLLTGLQNGSEHAFHVRATNALGAGPVYGLSVPVAYPRATIVGDAPMGVAVDTDANIIYVANSESDTVSVVEGVTWQVIDTIPVGDMPTALAVDPVTHRVFVSNRLSHDVTVIDGASRSIVATVPVGEFPWGMGVDPERRRVFVASAGTDSVSVIDISSNTMTREVPVGGAPTSVAIDPVTHTAYVVNTNGKSVSIIGPSLDVIGTLPIAGPELSTSNPITIAIDPLTHLVYIAGYLHKGVELLPIIKTIDGATNTPGPDLVTEWNFDWSIESVAINRITGWAYGVWNHAQGTGELTPSDEFTDHRFDARGLALTPLGSQPGVATGFTRSLHSVAIDDVRNIVYVTGTKSGHGLLVSFAGARRAQDIAIAGPSSGAIGGVAPLVTSGGLSGHPVMLSVDASSAPGVCSINGGVVALAAAGTCVIRAVQAGDDNFDAGTATHTIEIGLPAQTIAFVDPGPGIVGGSATLSAVGGASMNPVVFAVDATSAPGVCAVSGNVASYTAAGTCVIVATQAGNSEYLPAGPVTRSIVVVPAGAVISWSNPAPIVYGAALDAAQLNASANVPGTFTYSPAAGTVLNAGSHLLTVTFTPDDSVNYIASIASVTLEVAKANVMVAWPRPAAIAYGTPLGVAQLNAAADISGTFEYSPAAGDVLEVGMQTLSVTFTPDDAVNYAPVTAVTFVQVEPARPVIIWPQPAAIVYGTPLGDAQLNASTDVPGTLTYQQPAGTVLPAGTHTLAVKFTPDDSRHYAPNSTTVTLVVTTAAPVISWPRPEAIAYGTPLGSAQLNASADLPGTFEYSPAAGDVLEVGVQTLSVTFTPDDAVNYAPATAVTFVRVDPARPMITWLEPAAIVYGTPLGDTQLNASTDVPGTLTYQQPAGTVLPAGTHTLAVKFTPDDSRHYAPNSTTVTLTVTRATPTITWPTPAAIVAGTPLGASQLNATADASGTFAYSPAAGAVLPAGSGQILQAVFTPADGANYTGTTATVAIDVIAPPTATVTWPAPASIAYGTALGVAQLNATASMPGTFSYQPEAGTVLTPGTHVLRAVFTPSAGAPVTATTSLRVLSQRDVLLEQLAAMRALRGPAGNFGKRMQLEAAIFALAGALSPRLWDADGITLDDRQGSRVFILTRLSAKISGQAARGRRSGIDEQALEAIHRTLAEVDRQLAVTAIDAAGRRAAPDARRELRAGDEDFADRRYLSAMDHYGDAWEAADARRGRHNRHDDHDHDRDCRHGKRHGR